MSFIFMLLCIHAAFVDAGKILSVNYLEIALLWMILAEIEKEKK